MKILVTRSMALLLTLVLLLTMTPFTVLAEAVEMNEGMDGTMDILETNEADDPEIMDDWESETDVPDEDGFEDHADDPGVEDDWIDWYADDSDDRILTLITCDRSYAAKDGRLIVMAVEQ